MQNGPDRDRCVAALTSELDNADSVITAAASTASPSIPHRRRYSLQGRQQQRLRRHSLVSSSGVSSMGGGSEYPVSNIVNQRRRRNSCFALTHVNNNHCELSGSQCDLEVSSSSSVSSTMPMVVLTPESPRASPSAQVRTLFTPEEGVGMQGHGGGGFFIMGKSSNLTATCLDIDEEDLLNNNNNIANDNEAEATVTAVTSSSEDGEDGSAGSSSGFSLSTATLSHGELRLMQPDSAAPVATTAFTRIRDVASKSPFDQTRNDFAFADTDSPLH